MDLVHYLRNLKGSTLVLTHHNADTDGAASALALAIGLRKLDKSVSVGVAESVSRVARKVCEGKKILIDPDCARFDNVILADTSVPEQLASVKNLKVSAIIDHHPEGKLAEKTQIKWIEAHKSCAQMVYKVLKDLGVEIDKELGLILAAGIVADTAHLRFAERAEFVVLLELFDTGLKYSEVLRILQTDIDVSERIACLKAATRADLYRVGNHVLAVSKVISFEAAACRALLRAGADIAVVIAKKKDQVRISSRARGLKGKIDLSKIFKQIGKILEGSGGGHDLAGSANGPAKDNIKQAISHLLKSLESLGEVKRL